MFEQTSYVFERTRVTNTMEPAGSFHDPTSRMRFLTLHIHDMQSIRWTPLMLAAMAAPLFKSSLCPDTVAYLITGLALLTVPWFFVVRAHIRKTFGESNLRPAQKVNPSMWGDNWLTRFLLLSFITLSIWDLIASVHLHLKVSWGMVPSSLQMASLYGAGMLDVTNLMERRIVRGATAFVFLAQLLITQFYSLLGFNSQTVILWLFPCVGLVLLLVALYDYTLLHRCARAAKQELA